MNRGATASIDDNWLEISISGEGVTKSTRHQVHGNLAALSDAEIEARLVRVSVIALNASAGPKIASQDAVRAVAELVRGTA